MDISHQRRIKVDGIHHSDVYMQIALCVQKTGGVFMVVDGCDPTLQNLADIRNIMDGMVREIDRKLPQLVQASTAEMTQ